MRRLLEFVAAVVLSRLLGPPERPSRRRRRRAAVSAQTAQTARPRRRVSADRAAGKRALMPLGFLALGVVLMIPFETWFTLLAGVLALFAFIISGVFVSAAPNLLNQGGDTG
jgi:hypothetical protein